MTPQGPGNPAPRPRPQGEGEKRRRGFTLIEALVALLLVGLILPVAMRGVTSALQTSATANHMSEATELCRSKLAELSLSTDEGSLGGGGTFPDHPAYTWQSGYSSRNDGTDELTVTVSWPQSGGPQSLVLTTLVYFPTATASSGSSATP